ncbi:MAG: MBL fold metallo-hydrolase [Saprospiraceae bacterium]
MKKIEQLIVLIVVVCLKCTGTSAQTTTIIEKDRPFVVILGTAQDAGAPHIGCKKACCKALFKHPELRQNVVSLGIIDPENKTKYIIECTPDFTIQAKALMEYCPFSGKEMLDGIFISHAHIGHYAGLMYLGKEAISADKVPVYAMPGMRRFLETNGPWSQLVNYKNIELKSLENKQKTKLSDNLSIKPLQVPHRDEFSETVGFIIEGPLKKVLFIPDIDKWEKWSLDIIEVIKEVDYAFIDGTFYDGEEINNRNISEIPHPFIVESMFLFKDLPEIEKNKIQFIHLNHTNGALNPDSIQSRTILANGFNVARMNQIIQL